MADEVVKGVGKVVLGGVVGFGLYLFITGLGFGGGRGEGRGGEAVPDPARSRDEQRLNFLLSPQGFELRGVDWKPSGTRIYTLDEMIARVKEGARSDVGLKISGATLQGAVDAALTALKQAGIVVWKTEASAPAGSSAARVSGSTRGEYAQLRALGLREVHW